MTDEVIEAVAVPIDTDVRRVGEFGAWVVDAQWRADAALAKYVPAPIADEAGYGRAKKERTAIRKGRGTALIADSYVTMRLGDFAALLLMILRKE